MPMNDTHEMLLNQILDLLDTACQASLELLELYEAGEQNAAENLCNDLHTVAASVANAKTPLAEHLEYACTEEMLENIVDTLEDIQRSMRVGNQKRALEKIEFQLYPFYRMLWEVFYFWGKICPDPERMADYYQNEFAEHHSNPYAAQKVSSDIRLSIVVTAYNHLDTTKQCVEQLLKMTDFDALRAELILIDHGSSDGTLEYFEALGIGKVIRFKRNVRMYMFVFLAQICQGTYFSFVSNDILVTKDWAEILMNCLESDPTIIAAVPATPNIANLQMLHVPNNDPEEFIAWANKQNRSDPSRWNDRVRLMPPLGFYRTEAVSRIGFADPYFYSMEFWDDDFSLRAKRSGYRQIVCDDVACYHFGSVTGKEAQKKEGTLVYGRELFQKKNGVDAWGNGFCYDYQAVQLLLPSLQSKEEISFLGIDCGLGDTPLQVRNELRHRHKTCRITNVSCQEVYVSDLKPISDDFFFSENVFQVLDDLDGVLFDGVYLGRDISEYTDPARLLSCIQKRLAPGGSFVFVCANPFFAVQLHSLLQFSIPGGTGRLCLLDPGWIAGEAKKLFSSVQQIGMERQIGGLTEFARQHYGKVSKQGDIVRKLSTEKCYFLCNTGSG